MVQREYFQRTSRPQILTPCPMKERSDAEQVEQMSDMLRRQTLLSVTNENFVVRIYKCIPCKELYCATRALFIDGSSTGVFKPSSVHTHASGSMTTTSSKWSEQTHAVHKPAKLAPAITAVPFIFLFWGRGQLRRSSSGRRVRLRRYLLRILLERL